MSGTRTSRRGHEHGFGLVEAVIAGMILLIIGSAISTIVVSTMKTQATATRSERRMAAAEGLFERLKADNTWAGPSGAGCNTMSPAAVKVTCSSTWLQTKYVGDGLLAQKTSAQPITYDARITITGVDSNVDSQGVADEDGMRPDYYTANVLVWRKGQSLADPATKRSELTGNIDPPGRVTTGTMKINICQVVRQWDERIPVAGCPKPSEVMLGYPAGEAPLFGRTSSDPHSGADWLVAIDRAGASAGAFGWLMVTYNVVPANGVTIRLTRQDGGDAIVPGFVAPSGCSAPSRKEVRCTSSASAPIRRVSGLTPGNYDVRIVNVPAGYEPWPLHSIPSGDTAIVEAGRTSRVLQVIKPADRAHYTVSLRSCDHSVSMAWGGGPCVNRIEPYGVSGFLAPASSARAHWSINSSAGFGSTGVESVGRGASSITFDNLAPGLYTPRIVTQSQTSISLTNGTSGSLSYIWINPPRDGLWGGDIPSSGTPTYTRHWCDYNRRVAYLAGVGLGADGGRIERTGYVYKNVRQPDGTYLRVLDHTYTYYDVYYSAEAYCPHGGGGGGGGPPGPGGGGA